MKKKKFLLFASILLCFIVAITANAKEHITDEQLIKVKSNFVQEFRKGGVNIRAVEGYLHSINPDGSWSDIDYKDKTRSRWKSVEHLSRVRQMSLALRDEKTPLHNNPELKKSTLKALDYWIENDFNNPNWWWPIIGTPRILGEILLILDGTIEEKVFNNALSIIKRTLDYPGYNRMSGANLIWVLKITIYYGILTDNSEYVRNASQRVAGEIQFVAPTREGGILEDCSFIQHGPILYSHGYGASFLSDSTSIAAVLGNTEFALPKEKIEILARMTLEGNQWLQRNGGSDYLAEGRELVRPNQNAQYLKTVAGHLLTAGSERKEELRMLMNRLDNPNEHQLIGNRGFWCTDTIVHQRPEFYFSVRMCSPRTTNSEIVNGEGLKSWYIGCGANSIMRDGKEYENVFPLWNWSRIPGTTAPEIPGAEAKKVSFRGKREFVGVVSDGMNGLAGFDFELDHLKARKSWFFFDDGVLALGCGISDDSGSLVETTLNQSLLRGKVKVTTTGSNGKLETLEPEHGGREMENVFAIRHDGITYGFPESASNVYLKNAVVDGMWKSISNTASDRKIEGEIFLLSLRHGSRPLNAKYAYFVTGEKTDEALDSCRKSVRILKNETKIQAVWSDAENIGGIVFYEPGSLELSPGIHIERDYPCFVFVRKSGNNVSTYTSTPGNRPKNESFELPR